MGVATKWRLLSIEKGRASIRERNYVGLIAQYDCDCPFTPSPHPNNHQGEISQWPNVMMTMSASIKKKTSGEKLRVTRRDLKGAETFRSFP